MSNHEIQMTSEMGRAVFSSRDIRKGETVTVCELLVLSEQDTVVVNKTELQYYTFKYNDVQDCLVLGCGEIFNHAPSEVANVSYRLVSYGDRQLMQFEAKMDIKPGEQLFIDYSADVEVNTDEYTKQQSLF